MSTMLFAHLYHVKFSPSGRAVTLRARRAAALCCMGYHDDPRLVSCSSGLMPLECSIPGCIKGRVRRRGCGSTCNRLTDIHIILVCCSVCGVYIVRAVNTIRMLSSGILVKYFCVNLIGVYMVLYSM
jgi:hypothetical protein